MAQQQGTFPVFVTQDEEALSEQSIIRYCAWLRGELELLPSWHRLSFEYRQQLSVLERRRPSGPRPLEPAPVSSG